MAGIADVRELLARADAPARLAVDLYCYRICPVDEATVQPTRPMACSISDKESVIPYQILR